MLITHFASEKIHFFLNPYSYLKCRKNINFKASNIVISFDGISMIFFCKFLGIKNISRLSFDDTSLASHIFQFCTENEFSIALIGSKPGIVESAKEILEKKYANINIKFIHHGYFKNNLSILDNCLDCDVVICSMGSPFQEKFLIDLSNKGWLGRGFTCGGYLDQLVSKDGNIYYPKVIDKYNLRWLYRIFKEPKRLLFRYIFLYPIGIIFFIYDYLRKEFPKNKIL